MDGWLQVHIYIYIFFEGAGTEIVKSIMKLFYRMNVP